jgi:transmembrane sensor
MDNSRLSYLIQAYRTGIVTGEEWQELLGFIAADTGGAQTIPALEELLLREDGRDGDIDHARWQPILEGIFAIDKAAQLSAGPLVRGRFGREWRAAAAVILFLLGTGAWWIFRKQPAIAPQVGEMTKPNDIPSPVSNRATITLGNGQQIYLDSAGNGFVASQGGAQVVKLGSGQVVYKAGASVPEQGVVFYNTLTNPRGSQVVTVTLSDGTRVWLNAASSIHYPATFQGGDRTVDITGEAYFEVAQNAEKPFRVKKGATLIEVLGTSFNINAYNDEAANKVTLLDGKVRVRAANDSIVLQPGQQAIVTGGIHREAHVNVDAVIAWKNGLFSFKDADLQTVLRQLSRWYNVDILYEGKIPQMEFNGEIGKVLTLDQVLKVLSGSKVHYRIDNSHQLTIRP